MTVQLRSASRMSTPYFLPSSNIEPHTLASATPQPAAITIITTAAPTRGRMSRRGMAMTTRASLPHARSTAFGAKLNIEQLELLVHVLLGSSTNSAPTCGRITNGTKLNCRQSSSRNNPVQQQTEQSAACVVPTRILAAWSPLKKCQTIPYPRSMGVITVGILTVSDSCFRKEKPDLSGPKLEAAVTEFFENSVVIEKLIVPDDQDEIISVLLKCTSLKISLILTTGGTGFGPRDVTPEATKKVIEREAPGLAYAMISKSLEITPMAMLSRATCGIKNQSLIINLPGSAKGSRECFAFLRPALPHALALIVNNEQAVSEDHKFIQGKLTGDECPSKVRINNVAGRARKSPYPLFEVDAALEAIFQQLSRICAEERAESIPIGESLNRVLAEDVFSSEPVPPFDASIKDGYAILANDGRGPRKVRNFLAAGDDPTKTGVQPGEAVRICTGAPLPEGADAVVQVEDTTLLKKSPDGLEEIEISIDNAPTRGQDIRRKGSDIAPGAKILNKGDRIGPAHVGVLVTVGKIQVKVHKQARVGVISTGNELIDFRNVPKPGQIRDSNRLTLISLLKQFNYRTEDYGIARDEPTSLKNAITKALRRSDVVITTGGVSMGEFDLVKQILIQDFGACIHFGRVNMKPGKPTTFATLRFEGDEKMFYGLPGNPVSASVTCLLFVLPALKHFEGIRGETRKLPVIDAFAEEIITNSDIRPEYLRASIVRSRDGRSHFKSTGNQISSRLNSLVGANGLALIPPKTQLEIGQSHPVYLIAPL